MKIKKSGIFKTIDSKDFGLFQKQGWEKVIAEPFKKLEEVEKPAKKAKIEPIEEVVEEEPIKEVEQEEDVVIPKSKKRK